MKLAVVALTLTAVFAVPARAQVEEARGAVVIAVAKALGSGDTSPTYGAELAAARVLADRDFFCRPDHVFALPVSLRTRVVESVVDDLKSGQFRRLLMDRPAHVTDLISVAIVSFEYGRLLSIPANQRPIDCE